MTILRRTRPRGTARALVLDRTGGRCYLCGRQLDPAGFDADHLRAAAHGGGGELGNLAPACPSCNRARQHRRPADPDPRRLALALAARWSALGIRGRMVPPRVGPGAVVLGLDPDPGHVGPALRAAVEVRAALRSNLARVYASGGRVLVELPRWARPTVPLAALPAPAGLVLPLGLDSRTGSPVAVDLAAAPHALVAGQTGSGKSTALRVLAYQLARAGARLALADSDADTWGPFAGAAALAWPIAETPADCRALVGAVAGELGKRDRDAAPLVLIIDEVQTLDPPGRRALAEVLARGRKHGIRAILATQYVRADVLDRRLTDQAGWRIGGRVQDATASRLVMGSSGAEALTGAGDVLVAFGGAMRRVLVALPTVGELGALDRADQAPAALPTAPDADPDAGEGLDPTIFAWAQAQGPAVSARAIRRRWRIGQTSARAYRDAVRSGVTDRGLTDREGGL